MSLGSLWIDMFKCINRGYYIHRYIISFMYLLPFPDGWIHSAFCPRPQWKEGVKAMAGISRAFTIEETVNDDGTVCITKPMKFKVDVSGSKWLCLFFANVFVCLFRPNPKKNTRYVLPG